MSQQLLSDEATKDICLQHFYDSMTCFALLPEVQMDRSESMTRVISPDIPNWLTNAVFNINLAPNKVEAAIAGTTRYYLEHNVKPYWRVSPDDRPNDLEARLLSAGYEQQMEQIMMSVQLDTITVAALDRESLHIERISSASELIKKHLAFRRVDDSHGRSLATLMLDLFALYGYGRDSNWQHYVAIHDGNPAGYASAFYTEDVVGIYNVWTLAEERGKGIGTALTVRALQDAQARGYQLGTLQSTKMAHSMYQRIGFQTHFPIRYFAPV
ncbi:MAG: GNAT family N-acetyltransferase [Chloroflexota bacterium]